MLIGTAQAPYIGKLKTLLIKRNPKFCRTPYFEKSSKNYVNSKNRPHPRIILEK